VFVIIQELLLPLSLPPELEGRHRHIIVIQRSATHAALVGVSWNLVYLLPSPKEHVAIGGLRAIHDAAPHAGVGIIRHERIDLIAQVGHFDGLDLGNIG
jgi:hypothetical protein